MTTREDFIQSGRSASTFRLATLTGEQTPRLKARAKEVGVTGYGRMNRRQLTTAILEACTSQWG